MVDRLAADRLALRSWQVAAFHFLGEAKLRLVRVQLLPFRQIDTEHARLGFAHELSRRGEKLLALRVPTKLVDAGAQQGSWYRAVLCVLHERQVVRVLGHAHAV